MRGISLVVILVASSASAQTIRQYTIDNQTALTGAADGFNREECTSNKTHPVIIEIDGLRFDNYLVELAQYPTTGLTQPCPTDMTDPDLHVVVPDQQAPANGGHMLLNNITLSTTQLLGKGACTGAGERESVNYCFILHLLPNDTTASFVGGIPLDFDTLTPPLPVISSIDATDSNITFNFDTPDTSQGEVFSFIIRYRKCPAAPTTTGEGEGEGDLFGTDAGQALTVGEGEGEGTTAGETTSLCNSTDPFIEKVSTDPKIVLGPFTAGQQIEWHALLQDDFNNRGAATDLALAKTIPDLGPLDVYNGAGSTISCAPSCGTSTSSTDAGTLTDAGAFMFVVALTKRGRRTLGKIAKRGASAFLGLGVLVALLSSTNARADLGQMTVGMSLSPYRPDLDSEKLASGGRVFPMYSCIFGGKTQTEIGGAIDEHVFDDFGSLQLSFGLDLSQAQGFAQDTSLLVTHTCGTPTASAVQMTMLKMRPGITYRFDPALDAWGFPLVPYARLGFVGVGYMFTKNGNFDEGNPRVNPVGLRYGYEGAVGLMLALDFIESAARGVVNATDRPGLRIVSDNVDMALPDSTRRARANGTFDHTFLFVEGAYQPIDDFGQPGFVFSNKDTLFNTGYPILWRVGIAVELL